MASVDVLTSNTPGAADKAPVSSKALPLKEWPFGPEVEGWKVSHDGLRKQMQDFQRALAALLERSKAGAIPAWQRQTLKSWFDRFVLNVTDHHDAEEEIFFPEMAKRVTLPERFTTDHAGLLAQMDAIHKGVDSLATSTGNHHAAIEDLKAKMDPFQAEMCEHLKEEEDNGLPLLMQNWSFKEWKPTVDKMVAKQKPMDLPNVIVHLDYNEKREWLLAQEIPGFVVKFILIPRCRKYDKLYTQPMEDLIRGEQSEPQPKKGLFACFAH